MKGNLHNLTLPEENGFLTLFWKSLAAVNMAILSHYFSAISGLTGLHSPRFFR